MNINAMYFSPTKTTRRAVEGICKGLGKTDKTYDFTLPKGRKKVPTFTKEDLLVLGVPVYSGRIPVFTLDYLKELKGNQTPVILVAVYGNRDFEDTLLEMKDMLTEQGFVPVAGGAFIGEHSYSQNVATGRPDNNDLSIAEDFGKNVLELLNGKDLLDIELMVSGNFPYKDRKVSNPLGPTIDNTCIKCGMCVIACPTEALKMDGKVKVKDELCIRCHACTRACPIEAIKFDQRLAPVVKWVEENTTERMEPKLFLGK